MTFDEAYRAGLQDEIDGRPSLIYVLAIAGETHLLVAYGQGRLVGQQLLADEL